MNKREMLTESNLKKVKNKIETSLMLAEIQG